MLLYGHEYALAFYNRHKVKLSLGDTAGAIADLERCAELARALGQLKLSSDALEEVKVLSAAN